MFLWALNMFNSKCKMTYMTESCFIHIQGPMPHQRFSLRAMSDEINYLLYRILCLDLMHG